MRTEQELRDGLTAMKRMYALANVYMKEGDDRHVAATGALIATLEWALGIDNAMTRGFAKQIENAMSMPADQAKLIDEAMKKVGVSFKNTGGY